MGKTSRYELIVIKAEEKDISDISVQICGFLSRVGEVEAAGTPFACRRVGFIRIREEG